MDYTQQTEQEAAAEHAALMKAFVLRLETAREECVQDKAEIERRWVDDYRRYDGELNYATGTKQYPLTEGQRNEREPTLRYVMSRCNMVASRLSDMVFPHHDTAWDMRPTTKPSLGMMGPQEDQIDDLVEEACERMKSTIEDQLAESRFNATGRRMIDDCVKIGSGILKGPCKTIQARRKFSNTQEYDETGYPLQKMEMTTEESLAPGAHYTDPWKWFPELTESVDDCTQSWELHIYTKRMMTDLIDDPFFRPGAIREALKQPAGIGQGATRAMTHRCTALSQKDRFDDRFAIWEGYKFLEEEDLAALGIELDEPQSLPLYEVWTCNGVLLRAEPAPLRGDNRVPYYVVPFAKADDTMFGFGVSYLLRDRDQDIQSAWKAFLNNMSVSSGPLVITRKGTWKTTPEDYRIRGPKIILAEDDMSGERDLSKLFYVINFPNNAEQHLAALDRAIELGDEEIGMPALMAGNASENVQTSSGMAMLMNASNIVQRRFAMQFDDCLIVPLIERFYWWNMLHNPDQLIKGDFDVHPLGTSHLLVKDIQAQQLQIFSQISGDPRFAPYVDNYELLKANVKLLDLPTDTLLKDRQQAEDEIQGQQDSRAQIEMMKAQVAQGQLQIQEFKAKAEADDKARDDDYRATEREIKHREFMEEQMTKRMDAQVRMQLAAEARELEILKLAQQKDIDVSKLISSKEIASMREETARVLAGIESRMKAEEMALKLNPANVTRTGI